MQANLGKSRHIWAYLGIKEASDRRQTGVRQASDRHQRGVREAGEGQVRDR